MNKKYTDEELISLYKRMAKEIGRTPNFTDIEAYRLKYNDIPSVRTFRNRFGSIENLAEICGLYKKTNNQTYKKDFLINELQRFYKEHRKIPTQSDFEGKKNGYPSRKTFVNHFGSFNNALRAAGFDVKDKPEYTKEYLLNEIGRFIREFGRQPYLRDMERVEGYPGKYLYKKIFGSWNNAIKEYGLRPWVSQYTDEELEKFFFDFVEKNGRIPTLHEFNNNPDYPSFWCYQNRFGSWNKAIEAYGFEPIKGSTGYVHEFDNGEVCKSSYEYDVSNWLRKNNISYLRNIPYKDVIDWYDGKKDCDYLIIRHGEFIFVEIAGLYSCREKISSVERDYMERFNHKKEYLLSELNHVILYPEDFKKRTLDEMFSFLFEIDCPEWLTYEEIYQGV